MSNPSDSQSKYFDLHVAGIGYLNRVRMVKPKKGDEFMACSISALRGEYNKDGSIKPDSTKFDVRVSGSDAIKIIELLGPFNDKNRKIMIQFKLGDIYGETFVYEKDTDYVKKGDVGMMIKGRLLKIYRAWINNEPADLSSVYPESSNEHQDDAQQEEMGNIPQAANQ